MSYIMAFVAPVPAENKAAYTQNARQAAAAFKEYGALRIVECWGDYVPDGKVTSYPLSVQLKPGEVVVTGWQEWPDKATCDANMEKAMSDPRIGDLPFDAQRMIFAGFETLIDD